MTKRVVELHSHQRNDQRCHSDHQNQEDPSGRKIRTATTDDIFAQLSVFAVGVVGIASLARA
jgi:hypothetical protein